MSTLVPTVVEDDLSGIRHPDHLRLGRRHLALVDDELVSPLQRGDGLIGWEGDPRLALYIDAAAGEWVLVRLEVDRRYRIAAVTDPVAAGMGPVDVVGHLIAWCVTHDRNRGYDPAAVVLAANDAREVELDRQRDDLVVGELAPRLRHALKSDLGAHF